MRRRQGSRPVTTNGANPAAADAFLTYMVEQGRGRHSRLLRLRLAEQECRYLVARPGPAGGDVPPWLRSKVQFVLGDLLPGDLVDEYRVQLQKFLQDPSDATIDAVTAAIEAKAQEVY